MSGKEYEKFYELFRCDPKDNRINLFIDAIITNGEMIYGEKQFKSGYYEKYVSKMRGIFNGDELTKHFQKELFSEKVSSLGIIHNEWVIFFKDLLVCAHVKSNESVSSKKKKHIELINELKMSIIYDTKLLAIKMLMDALYSSPSTNNFTFNTDVLLRLFHIRMVPFNMGDKMDASAFRGSVDGTPFNTLNDVCTHLFNNVGSNSGNTSMLHFTYRYEKYVNERMKAARDAATLPSSEDFWIKESDAITTKYTRKPDGQIYDEKGELVPDETINNKAGMCSGFFGDEHGTDENLCSEFILQCLEGHEMAKCKKYFTNDHYYWAKENDEIINMSPNYIQHLIKALQIPTKRDYNAELNINIDTLVTCDEWLTSLHSNRHLNSDEVKAIKRNEKLIKFITKLITFVQIEPAILNPNFIKDNKTKSIIQNNVFSNTTLFRFGLLPNFQKNYPVGISTVPDIRMSDIQRLYTLITDMHANFYRLAGLRFQSGGAQSNSVQFGGAYSDSFKPTHNTLRNYFDHLEIGLKNRNKSLDPGNRESIINYLKNLKQSEENLMKGFKVIEEYSKMIYRIGDDVTETLSLPKLEELTKERNSKFERVAEKQIKGLDMIRLLVEKISDITP